MNCQSTQQQEEREFREKMTALILHVNKGILQRLTEMNDKFDNRLKAIETSIEKLERTVYNNYEKHAIDIITELECDSEAIKKKIGTNNSTDA